ncbi:hypothetical protein ACLMJK_005540 [Lecanora helva]
MRSALAFNDRECNAVNVSIPTTLGCSSTSSSTPGGQVTTTVEVAISEPTTNIATFTGGSIFTGTCSSVQFASASIASGQTFEYPWLGCSDENPNCCPFDIHVGGALTVCPADYITTQGGCCPSGWSVYSSAIDGETPCVTTPSKPVQPPTALPAQGASASVITSQLFSPKYTLTTKSSSTLATGAIAGIAVGGFIVLALIAAAAAIFIRKRRAKARKEREDATIKSPRANTFEAASTPVGSPVSELPSPQFAPPRPMSMITPTTPAQPPGGAELPAVETPRRATPVEMAGDTFINEYHPAHISPPQSPPPRSTANNTPAVSANETASTNLAVHDPRRDTMATDVSEETSPIYSPIGGSALLPDSPHLNGAFRSTAAAEGRPVSRERPTSGEFPDSPRQGSVREIVEEFEKGQST